MRFIVVLSILLTCFEAQLASAETFNVTINPFALLVGSFSGGVDVAVTDKITIGGYGGYSKSSFTLGSFTATRLGLRSDISLSDDVFEDGWYAAPFVSYYTYKVDVGSDLYKSGAVKFNATNFGAILGYGWFWDSGINIRAGLGPMYSKLSGNLEVEKKDGTREEPNLFHSLSGFLPTGDLIVAWVF